MNCESNVSIACGDSQRSDEGDALFFSLRVEIADFGLTEGVTIKVSLKGIPLKALSYSQLGHGPLIVYF